MGRLLAYGRCHSLAARYILNGWRRLAPLCLALVCLALQGCTSQEGQTSDRPGKQLLNVADAPSYRGGSRPYPIALGPLTWVERQTLTASDGAAGDSLGDAMAMSGNTVIIGASRERSTGKDSGSAYVFVRNASTWAEEQKLTASDSTEYDRFGSAIALSGDTALIGAFGDDDAGSRSGSAYVFVRNAGTWAQQQKLLAGDGAASDVFGEAVALNGDTALIGALGDDDLGSSSGSAYVFVRNAGTWAQQQKLLVGDASANALFGDAVAVDGDTALVGASRAGGPLVTGAAYVFVRNAGNWSEQGQLSPGVGASQAKFGDAVSVRANTALVGAPRFAKGRGLAYVFVRAADNWSEEGRIGGSDPEEDDSFGAAVALADGSALVGAPGDDAAFRDSGAAYLFARSAGAWSEEQRLASGDGVESGDLGVTVALNDDALLVGSSGDDAMGGGSGSVSAFTLRLVEGQACANPEACASSYCADGVCCAEACDGPCETCGAIGLEGACSLIARGGDPLASCGGHLCNGVSASCPKNCGGDADCSSDYHCQDAIACLSRAPNGDGCLRDAGCLSGHCIDGICCAQACDAGCGSCAVEGLAGICAPLQAGHSGAPNCAPYLCTGRETTCPNQCTIHRECASGHHCTGNVCQPDGELGGACTESDSCGSKHCTDAICCIAASCGAYRCGPAGTCEDACSSTAQCAQGHECSSAGRCVALFDDPQATQGSGSCSTVRVPPPRSRGAAWYGAFGLLAFWLARRRRRHRPPRYGLVAILGGLCAAGSQACTPEGGAPNHGSGELLTQGSGAELRAGAGGAHGPAIARYPISSSPLVWAEQQEVWASDGALLDQFGQAVAISGETAVIAAPSHDDAGDRAGAAYVFVRNASAWAEEQKLLASDGAALDFFGSSVAISGHSLVVGAHGVDASGSASGAAYVFVRNASSWVEEQKLLASDGAPGDSFGASVAITGDVVVIGAQGAAGRAGAAYAFARNAGSWAEEQKLRASAGVVDDFFGRSVALHGNTAIIGADGDDEGGTQAGAAYVFVHNAGSWSEEQKLMAKLGAQYDSFGAAVSIHGDLALVGAYRDDDGGNDSGSAYVFERSASTWVEERKLLASDGGVSHRFGVAVALGPTIAMVGAEFGGDAGFNYGAAYVFERNASRWGGERKLLAGDRALGDRFGASVAMDADIMMVGAPHQGAVNSTTGAAYAFSLLLVQGQTCANDDACAGKACVDGVCCAGPCAGSCEVCNMAGLQGVCTVSPRGGRPSPSCQGHLCDGVTRACAEGCRGDLECASDHYCRGDVVCLPRTADGELCVRDGSCVSGHCVDGVCCAKACDDGCGSCARAGLQGVCAPLPAGQPGALACAPYLCTGSATSCPTRCAEHADCALGHHCDEERCATDALQGAACDHDASCATSHCTDEVCCAAASCGAYRCGAEGGCLHTCSSSAECAADYACSSSGACELRVRSAHVADGGSSCHMGRLSAGDGGEKYWLGLLACLALFRQRRWSSRGGFRAALTGLACLGLPACDSETPPPGDGSAAWGERAVVQSGGASLALHAGASTSPSPWALSPSTWAAQQRLWASDGAPVDVFGGSVALDGGTALIGASATDDAGSSSGSAYAFARSAGSWSEQQKLLAVDGAQSDSFGSAVALGGDAAIVGARGADALGIGSGAAYVFLRSATEWTEQQKLAASDGTAWDYFGGAIAMNADVAIIGASNAGVGGGAYVFVRNAGSWSEEQRLWMSGGAWNDSFGVAVAVHGNVVIVGAASDDDAGSNSGSAFVFSRNASAWVEERKLVASDAEAGDSFGGSVAVDGNIAVVGAAGDDDAADGAGAAYVFERTASNWIQSQKLTASDGGKDDGFGASLSLSQNAVAIGAEGDDDAGDGAGAGYVFVRNASLWAEAQKLVASDGAAADSLGGAVALGGDTVIIGAVGDDDAGELSGSAYVFALRLGVGDPCAGDEACASHFCVDGFCCSRACDGPCENCNVAGQEGACSLALAGSVPTPDCQGHLCNGIVGSCPEGCRGDDGCSAGNYCQAALECLPRTADGESCARDAGCISGHCVDGICCEQACNRGCGSCALTDGAGTCSPLPHGPSEEGACGSYQCNGNEVACPSDCDKHADCTPGHHCAEARCESQYALGIACGDEDAACTSTHCTDGLCCIAASCSPYRCGPAGACESSCSASAPCQSGYRCASNGQCERQPGSADAATDSGACTIAGAPARGQGAPSWLGGLALLACLAATGRRVDR